MRHRLSKGPHPALVEHVAAPGIDRDLTYVWRFMLQAHLAHALMLGKTGIVAPGVASALVDGLRDLVVRGSGALDRDASIEDVYFNVEKHLTNTLGADVAGQLQTGRSRNDHLACVARLWVRSELVRVAVDACLLREALLQLARQHVGTVMTGYTHQQPGQPITFGHYLLSVEAGLARDTQRLRDAWRRVNLSPLGSGSMAGVSWPVDRRLLAELLGFDGLLPNSVDAVASRDFALEAVGAMASLTLTVGRLATDLQQFVTWEFGGMQVSDAVAAVSSVMPQKKNPVAFEHCKGAAAQVIGAWTAMAVAVKSTPYSHQRETSVESMRPFAEAVAQTRKSLALMSASLEGLVVDAEVLKRNAAENFSTATDLADMLVRDAALSFREAHGVVGAAVRRAFESGRGIADLAGAELDGIAREVTGKSLAIDRDKVLAALDPVTSVAARSVPGGPALASVQSQIADASERLAEERVWVGSRISLLEAVADRLESTAARGGTDGGAK